MYRLSSRLAIFGQHSLFSYHAASCTRLINNRAVVGETSLLKGCWQYCNLRRPVYRFFPPKSSREIFMKNMDASTHHFRAFENTLSFSIRSSAYFYFCLFERYSRISHCVNMLSRYPRTSDFFLRARCKCGMTRLGSILYKYTHDDNVGS
jgi:hypothetical protein